MTTPDFASRLRELIAAELAPLFAALDALEADGGGA